MQSHPNLGLVHPLQTPQRKEHVKKKVTKETIYASLTCILFSVYNRVFSEKENDCKK
jgi:hypothetical protein